MSFRYMRVIVFFDLPVTTSSDRKHYREFRRFLIKSGFLMLQESVYCKLAPNSTTADSIVDNVRANKPSDGTVQILKITENSMLNGNFSRKSIARYWILQIDW